MIRTLDEHAVETIARTIPFARPPNVFWYYEGEHYRHVSRRFRGYVKRSGVCPFRSHDVWHLHGSIICDVAAGSTSCARSSGTVGVKTTEIYPQLFTPEATKVSKTATFPARAADDKAEKQHQGKEELDAKRMNAARRSLRLKRSVLTRGATTCLARRRPRLGGDRCGRAGNNRQAQRSRRHRKGCPLQAEQPRHPRTDAARRSRSVEDRLGDRERELCERRNE